MARSRSRSASRSASPVKRRGTSPPEESKSCPFLIRLFITKGKHTAIAEFDEGRFPLKDEFQTYGWKHSTPSSLIRMLYPSFPPPYRSPVARFSFRHVYVDASQRGLYRSTDLVSFIGRDLVAAMQEEKPATSAMDMELEDEPRVSGRKIEEKTLDGYGFITGDLLSVSLHIPEPKIPRGAPAAAAGSAGPPTSLGWDRHGSGGPAAGPRGAARGGPERGEHWARGDPLPPQHPPRGDTRGTGPGGRDPTGGGSWRGGRGGANGIGIRGAGRRSPDRGGEPEPRGPAEGDRYRGGDRSPRGRRYSDRQRSRSRSPVGRDSYSRR